jgi:hypothetical protein
MTNPGGVPIDVLIRYQPSAVKVLSRSYRIGAYKTLLFEDVVKSVFNAGEGRGPVRVETVTKSVSQPVLTSRTIAERSFGNLGQGMPAAAGAEIGTWFLPGLIHDDNYRTNVAVTAAEASGVNASFELYRGNNGVVAWGVERFVAAGRQDQWSIENLFPGYSKPGVPMTVRVRLWQPGVTYASTADQHSTDAVTYIGKKAEYNWIVPAVAHNPGADDTFWSSNVAITNLGSSSALVSMEFLPEQTDNSGGGLTTNSMVFNARSTTVLEDVAFTKFGVEDGKGALVIRSTQQLVVSSRVFTDGPNGGTIGHGLEAVTFDALSMEQRVLPGVRMRNGYRTNVGVMTGESSASVRFRLRNQNGVLKAETWKNVPARSMRQWSVDRLFGSGLTQLPNPAGSLVVDSTNDFAAYLVVVDPSSNDPVLFMAE